MTNLATYWVLMDYQRIDSFQILPDVFSCQMENIRRKYAVDLDRKPSEIMIVRARTANDYKINGGDWL